MMLLRRKIQVIVLAKQNSVDLAEKEKELAKQRAGDEKTINDLVADRLDAIKKQKKLTKIILDDGIRRQNQ